MNSHFPSPDPNFWDWIKAYGLKEDGILQQVYRELWVNAAGNPILSQKNLLIWISEHSHYIIILPNRKETIDSTSLKKSFLRNGRDRQHTFDKVHSIIKEYDKKNQKSQAELAQTQLIQEELTKALINKGR